MHRKLDPEQEERDERSMHGEKSAALLLELAANAQALADSYEQTAVATLRYREHVVGRGEKWSQTYHAKRDREEAAKWKLRAEIRRRMAAEIEPEHVCGKVPYLFDGECPACTLAAERA